MTFVGLLLFVWGIAGVAVEVPAISNPNRVTGMSTLRGALSTVLIAIGAWIVWFR